MCIDKMIQPHYTRYMMRIFQLLIHKSVKNDSIIQLLKDLIARNGW